MPKLNNQKTTPDEWFSIAKRDFESAELLLQHDGHPNSIALLIQQAVEKYLKGYLYHKVGT